MIASARKQPEELLEAVEGFLATLRASPLVKSAVHGFTCSTPELELKLDRKKAEMLGLTPKLVFSTLQNKLASYYVNDFNLKGEDGSVLSIGYCYESFGIIVNKALLDKAGHSLDEITNFESLKAVADDIHARASELGFDAFTSAGLDGSSSWRFSGHLLNMPLFYQFRDDGVT